MKGPGLSGLLRIAETRYFHEVICAEEMRHDRSFREQFAGLELDVTNTFMGTRPRHFAESWILPWKEKPRAGIGLPATLVKITRSMWEESWRNSCATLLHYPVRSLHACPVQISEPHAWLPPSHMDGSSVIMRRQRTGKVRRQQDRPVSVASS